MKKHLFLGFLGALALASCSNDEPIENGGGNNGANGGNGEVQYLAVNIVSTPASRAEGTQHPESDPDGKATYEEGYASENAVSSVRFYFFDTDNAAFNISNSEAKRNYFDWTPSDAGQDLPNVEKQLTATIVLHKGKPEAGEDHPNVSDLPTQMIAILNPQVANLGTGMLSLADLRKIEQDYVTLATGEKGAFVMANSVYKGNGGAEMVTTPISESNYQASADLALNYPINIYVERNVAKVRVKFNKEGAQKDKFITIGGSTTGQYDAMKLYDKEGKEIKVKVDGVEKQLYLRSYGWNVTGETDYTYLS